MEQHDGTAAEAYASAVDVTEFGLPRRTRQASLAPELRDPLAYEAEPAGDGPLERSPDETRDAFTALQRGWERGRADSALEQAQAWADADAGSSGAFEQPGGVDDAGTSSPFGPEHEARP
jgi:hypothetical protein